MSGEIFQPLDNFDELDVTKWNPLICHLCNEKYEDPCILSCYHSFCSRCLRGRDVDQTMACPLCGVITNLREGQAVPQTDQLTKFLVDQSSSEDKEPCANCDKVSEQMYFCNTCSQPLCSTCREETHKAKMFARHDVVSLSKRTKEIHRECPIHQEPYILFSTEKKSMLCINCFRDMKIESRSHCVDLETAYTQGCNKLDQSLQAIRDLQSSVRDSIFLLKALLNEILQNSQMEKKAITDLYDSIQEQITEKKAVLLTEVDTQFKQKEQLFKAELVTLKTLLPTLHTHLIMSAAFSSSANRFEFLDLAYVLMDRLKSIIHQQHPLHPSQGGQICTDYKVQFAKCMEPLLFPYRNSASLSSISSSNSLSLSNTNGATASSKSMSVSTASPVVSPRHLYSGSYIQNVRRCGYNSQKLHFTDSKGVFAEHCREFDNTHKEYCMRVEKMKNSVQELQRDITLRRCLAKKTSVTDLQKGIDNLENDLEMHYVQTEQRQPALEKHWEEIVQQIANEQDLFQVQMHSVVKLKQEIGLLRTILTQLTSFVTSITVLTERLAPKLSQTCKDSDHDNTIAALFEEINTMQPDSQHRVDAIRQAQEERETLSASNRENPLDKELIKTKGLLRAPSARREGVSRRNSTKRESRELKDIPVQSPSDSSESKEETSKSQSPKCLDNSAGLDVLPKNTQAVKSDSSECLNVTKNAKEIKDDLEGKNLEKNKTKSVRDSRESVQKHGESCDPDVNENNKESKIPQHKSGSLEVDMSTQTDMLNSKDTSNSLESCNDVKTSRTAVKHQNDSDFSEGNSSLAKDDKCGESTESDKCAKGVRSASDSVDKLEKHEKSEIKVANKSDRTSLSKCTEPPGTEAPNKTDVCNSKGTKAEKPLAAETSNVVDLSNSTEVEKPSGAVKSNKTDSSNSTEVKELLENS